MTDLATEGQAGMALQFAQPVGPTCGWVRHIRQALGESPARAGVIEAATAPRLEVQRHWLCYRILGSPALSVLRRLADVE